jgi:hypothetical protein
MNLRPRNSRRVVAGKCTVAAMLFVPSLLIPSSHAEDRPKASVVASGATVADGRPWDMYMIEVKQAFTLTLMPNGTGIMEPGTVAPELTWWQSGDRLCLKPSALKSEHCVTLLVREGGYDAVENDALFFKLRR